MNRRQYHVVSHVICAMMTSLALAGTDPAGVGYDDLVARIGEENVPTGENVAVSHVEAPDGDGDYGPDQGLTIFDGKTFFEMSGSTNDSGHATFVGQHFYANNSETSFLSLSPDVTEIYLYNAIPWLQSDYLNIGGGAAFPPEPTPGGIKVFNNSWIANLSPPSINNDALRRADFASTRDDILIVNGVNNGSASSSFPLMGHTFNGIAVGRNDGNHVAVDTDADFDGPGRMKPEIVAPDTATSWTTGIVSSSVAMLTETARTESILAGNPTAERSEVLKAVILAGARHRAGWTNNPDTAGPNRGVTDRPLDDVYGVDVLNVNNSHLILTGGEQDGDSSVPTCVSASHAGWDLESLGIGESRYYRFRVPLNASEVSILATWHRIVDPAFAAPLMANIDLILWAIDETGQLSTLVGDSGVGVYASGNVVSESSVDNVEHLYITDLEPGEYVLEVDRIDTQVLTSDVAIAWLFPEPPRIGDLNNDGTVNVDDLLLLIGSWGTCNSGTLCLADLDGNCTVNVDDLLILIGNWGS